MKRLLMLTLAALLLAGCAARTASTPHQAASEVFESVKDDPVLLRAYLTEFPKGGELHSHLSGAVYAEDYLRWAADSGMCVDTEALKITAAPCHGSTVQARKAISDYGLYTDMIDSLSTRDFHTDRTMWGHDHFFASFDKFGPASEKEAAMLAEVKRRAADQNELYLELMRSHYPPELRAAAKGLNFDGDAGAALTRLKATGVFDTVPEVLRRVQCTDSRADQMLIKAGRADAARVQVRWINQVIRVLPPDQVFAMIAYSFALCAAEDHVVGFNLVAPEDNPVAMDDYRMHMRMIRDLRQYFPQVNVSLHAGELRLGLVEPEGLTFHIREAVQVAGARRIGHGVALAHEKNMHGLLDEMNERGVAMEICLSSNAQILGVSGSRHPVRTYMEAGVPVTLNTDDEGVERVDLTHEYQRAVQEQGFGYDDLMRASRNVLEYSFLPGPSLWADAERFVPVAVCADSLGLPPSPACAEYLGGSEKAALQWELEQRFRAFECNVTDMECAFTN